MTTAAISNPSAETLPTSQPQLAALLNAAGISPLAQTGWIRVTGDERVRWLNGMATNSVQQLTEKAKVLITSSSTRRDASRETATSLRPPTPF